MRILFFLLMLLIVPCSMTPSPANAGEDPDALYREGRFGEAEQAYARLDMDHPKDVRYRFNRGCAAFQGGDFQAAAAAFSSVLRRAQDPQLQFKAAYNLANTVFRQGDMESAAALYRQALRLNPGDEDARYNLELSLRELERLKEQQKKPPEKQPEDRQSQKGEQGQQSQKGEQQGPQDRQKSSPGDENKAQDRKKEGDRQAESRSPERNPDAAEPDHKTDGAQEEQKQPREERAKSTEPGKEGEKKPETLDGKLSPLRPMEEQGPTGQEGAQGASAMDKKRAEALLDNVQEDRSRFLRFNVPADKKGGVRSGKEW